MEKYSEVEKIYDDIKNLNIQGATNVAIATFEGMKLYEDITKEKDKELFYKEFFEIGDRLSHARANEPMAVNGVKFVKYSFNKKYSVLPELATMKRELAQLCDEFLGHSGSRTFSIGQSKKDLLEKSTGFFSNFNKIFTHCHSSTAVSLIKSISKKKKNFEVVCTETRPRLQGRITAKSLLEARIKTTLIADSAAESFIINRGSIPIEIVFIGCDEITMGGHAINKIGSWGLGMAAHYADKPFYVVTPLLKLDVESYHHNVKIEIRESKELWEDAPKGLHMYNPAFEIVDKGLITGYVTEFGILKPGDIKKTAKDHYPWLFTN
jgi:ribose 1,5-bisphosphate isomerase